jgi:hypothetical protein
LTRADVKRSLGYNFFASPSAGLTPVERVIEGWRTDRRFGKPGHPKLLKISGPSVSFAGLARKYGGDVPHRAVLDELRRIGAVSGDGSRVRLLSPPRLRRRHDFAFLSPVLPALVDGLRIASRKAGPSRPASVHRLSLPVETDVDLAILRERCASSAKSMLDGLGHSLGRQVTLPRRRKPPTYLFTITVLLAESRAKRPQRAR